jgi:hypothetical protein
MKKSLLQDATDLGDFAADIAEQPLEDIAKKKLKKYHLNLKLLLN